MNIILVIVLIVIIILLIIVISLMNTKKTDKKIDTRNNNINKSVNLDNISFPKGIEQMNKDIVVQACKVMFDSYKSLDYVNKSPSSLDRREWHSWQVSILLYFLKKDYILPLSNKIELPVSIANLSERDKQLEIQKIFYKYTHNVNIEKDRDTLSNDIIWNAREVSIILSKII